MPFLLFMPSYNQARYIVEAVQSVLAQDDRDWELWIVDNSSDNTPEVMRQFDDPRIRFHHIPERMDPGSCLNWMLARAVGREFSYVHTDNNLHPSFVRRMRSAMAGHPLALCYCDMRTIDERGRYLNVYKRGEFDLARLVSVDSLGVPFSATIELAKKIGGFSVRDYADDVRFCIGAFGFAHYIYLSDALVDYRLHGSSRTEAAGGSGEIQRVFIDLMAKVVPILEARDQRPLAALEEAIRQGFVQVDLVVQDVWYRKLARRAEAWWIGLPKAEYFFCNGLLDGKSLRLGATRPRMRFVFDCEGGERRARPFTALWVKVHMYLRRRDLRRVLTRTRNHLVSWAAVKLPTASGSPQRLRLCSLDFRTVWAACQIQNALGIVPVIDASVSVIPPWLDWPRAQGNEPTLNCADNVSIQIATTNSPP